MKIDGETDKVLFPSILGGRRNKPISPFLFWTRHWGAVGEKASNRALKMANLSFLGYISTKSALS